ncbi:hypothetical protein K1719_002987 [Acacia pycnantha]|nr:hypothetical protein K1719_002987 [Acacia pycnantha]
MALEPYAAGNPDKFHTDVLTKARAEFVKHFDRQYCQNKRVQRLLDDKGARRGPLMLPQPYTFKPTA